MLPSGHQPEQDELANSPSTVASETVSYGRGRPDAAEGLPACIGRYGVEEEIARGGMGRIVRIKDEEFQRPLALKVMLARGSAEQEERFLREARLTGRLQHPGIPPVHELGRLPDGRPYFIMKLVEGQSLKVLLQKRASAGADLPRFVAIFEQICQTVAYAHAQGVLHRDLKPSNVMVGAFSEVQVMDWGLAKEPAQLADPTPATESPGVGSGSTASKGATVAGSVLGTPAYMPPEQARGEIADLDPRADVFGLGAMLCEILTLQPPYVGHDVREVLDQAARADLTDALARLDRSGVDRELIELTRRCLAANKTDRPRDAAAVAAAVTAYQAHLQERVRRAEIEQGKAEARAAGERKRRRLTVALAGAVLLALAVGGASWWWIASTRALQAEEAAHVEQARLTRRAETARSVDEVLTKAALLRDRAKEVSVQEYMRWKEALRDWKEALATAKNAEALLAAGEADEATQRRVVETIATLTEEARTAETDRDFVDRVGDLRIRLMDRRDLLGNREQADREFADLFKAYGIDEATLSVAQAGERVRNSALQPELVGALVDWGLLRMSLGQARAPDGQRLLKIADLGDVAPIWQAVVEDSKALETLAADPQTQAWPTSKLVAVGLALALGGQDQPATTFFRTAQRRHPGEFWLNVRLAAACTRTQPPQWDDAVRFYGAALALRPRNVRVYISVATALARKGADDEAFATLHEALQLQPDSADVYSTLGGIFSKKGMVTEAIKACEKAIHLDPKLADAHSNLASALTGKGDLDGAIKASKEAIRLDPERAQAHNNLGSALNEQGRFDEAIPSLKEAVRLDRDYAEAHNNLGFALDNKGARAAAAKEFREAIRLKPGLASAHANLAGPLIAKREFDEAIATCKEAIRLDSKLHAAHNNLAAACFYKGDYQQAIVAFREAVRLKPNSVEAHFGLAGAYIKTGAMDECEKELRETIRLKPDFATAHLNLGGVLYKRDAIDEGIAAFRTAVRLDPNLPGARPSLIAALSKKAVSLDKQGRLDEAGAVARELTRVDPKDAWAWNLLGVSLTKKGAHADAVAALQEAVRLAPKVAAGRVNLANALLDHANALSQEGNSDQAVATWKDAIRHKPDFYAAHYQLGAWLLNRGSTQEAVPVLKEAVRLKPDQPQAYNSLGLALTRQGAVDEGVAELREAIRLKPDYAIAHANLGFALKQKGDFAHALAAASQSLKLSAGDPARSRQFQDLVRECERLVELDKKLAAVRAGNLKPADAVEALELAKVCLLQEFYAAAVPLYSFAFAAQPASPGHFHKGHRLQAARAAVMAAAGQGRDASKPKAQDLPQLRTRALEWLGKDLNDAGKLFRSQDPDALSWVLDELPSWPKDPKLASVRDPDALTKLPPKEQVSWRQLWSDIDDLLKQARAEIIETRIQGSLAVKDRARPHDLKLVAGQRYVIELRSAEFDPYLRLVDSAGKVLLENDDVAPGNLNARLVFTPGGAGAAYQVVATSFQQRGVGSYTLIVRAHTAPKK